MIDRAHFASQPWLAGAAPRSRLDHGSGGPPPSPARPLLATGTPAPRSASGAGPDEGDSPRASASSPAARTDRGGVPPAGLTGGPLDRPGHRHRGHDAPSTTTGALTDATPVSRSSTLCGPTRRGGDSIVGQHLGRRPPVHGQDRPDRDDGAQAVRRLERHQAHPGLAGAHDTAGRSRPSASRSTASTGVAASTSDRRVLPLAGRPRRTRPGPSTKRPDLVAIHQEMALEGGGQPVRGGPRQAGRPGQVGQRPWAGSRARQGSRRPCPAPRHRLHSAPINSGIYLRM